MATPLPKYTLWEAVNVSISLGMRAIEEIRYLASRPEPRNIDRMAFDDISVDYDGERSFVFKFTKNGETKEFPIRMPVQIYRGIYKDDESYQRGDTVTWGGSVWIAEEDTSGHIRDHKGWRLAVKAGRDGRKV